MREETEKSVAFNHHRFSVPPVLRLSTPTWDIVAGRTSPSAGPL